MTTLLESTNQFKADLAARSDAAMSTMVKGYTSVVTSLEKDIRKLTDLIDEARANGVDPKASWLYQQERYQALLGQARVEFGKFGGAVDTLSASKSLGEARKGSGDALQQMEDSLDPDGTRGARQLLSFNRLPTTAIQELVGQLREDSPLHQTVTQYGTLAADTIKNELTSGLAKGLSPDQIFRNVRKALDGAIPPRAATLIRTEMYRSYRESNRSTYDANKDIVDKWIWHADLRVGTCSVCWGMHGEEFDTDVPMGTHPNCRCTMRPKTKTWEELGFPGIDEPRIAKQNGQAKFDKLTDAEKRKILGKGAFDEYQKGNFLLQDTIAVKQHSVFGTVRNRKSLDATLRTAQSRLPNVAYEPFSDVLSASELDEFTGNLELDHPARAALASYVSAGHRSINGGLRAGAELDALSDEDWMKRAVAMNRAIRANPLPGDVIAFRGLGDPYTAGLDFTKVSAGDVLTDKAFLSSSLDRHQARSFAVDNEYFGRARDLDEDEYATIFEIRAPKGSSALYLGESLGSHEKEFSEKELLFAPGVQHVVIENTVTNYVRTIVMETLP